MQLRGLFNLGLGLVLAGGAVTYARQVILAPPDQLAMADIVVATEDISFGHVIEPGMIELRSWPADAVPASAYSSLEAVVGTGSQELRRAKRPISAGEVLLSVKVSNFGETVTVTELIEPDMWAAAIRVNDVTGVAGFVSPGDLVDVILTRRIEDDLRAQTILQGVKVLGIDQVADQGRERPSVAATVTVQVRPEEVQKLALAQQAGTLTLSLRNLEVAEEQPLEAIEVSDLSPPEKPEPVPAPQPVAARQPEVQVNRGGERSTVPVPSG
jgi:pilus assembly protein CpaB